jgi:hypothetical protein
MTFQPFDAMHESPFCSGAEFALKYRSKYEQVDLIFFMPIYKSWFECSGIDWEIGENDPTPEEDQARAQVLWKKMSKTDIRFMFDYIFEGDQ